MYTNKRINIANQIACKQYENFINQYHEYCVYRKIDRYTDYKRLKSFNLMLSKRYYEKASLNGCLKYNFYYFDPIGKNDHNYRQGINKNLIIRRITEIIKKGNIKYEVTYFSNKKYHFFI